MKLNICLRICNNYTITPITGELRLSLEQVAALKSDYNRLAHKYLKVLASCIEAGR